MRGSPFLVHHLLEACADARPDSVFVTHEGVHSTYSEIEAAANRVAHLLVERGVRRGERVGLLANNGRFYVDAYYGILKTGAIAVPLNTASDGSSLRHFLADCGARALIAETRFARVVDEAVQSLPELDLLVAQDPARHETPPAHIRVVPFSARDEMPDRRSPARTIDLDAAQIIYTSGSTGRPRGATLTHANVVANTRSIVSYLGIGPDDSVLQILPFYYVYGKSLLNTHAAVGGRVVVENRFMFPNTALDTLEGEACTGLSGVPSTFAILLNRSNFAKRPLGHLTYVTQAGGGMSPALTRRLIEVLSGKRIFVMYGATEASARLTYLDPDALADKVGSIGKAIPNVEMRVLRDDGTEAGVDEVGELVARGANIMRGYWNDREETDKVLDASGYHTGDLGRRDAEGYLWVVGRKKDMIKAGAHRVSAKEIEDALLEHEDVHEAAVIGVPDEILGETIRAYVVLRDRGPDDSTRELTAFLKRRLPAYKVPAAIEVRHDLPKNESGKIMKQVLRAEAGVEASKE